jgi:hypothetical protein
MINHNIHIIEFEILHNILEEIKDILKFKIFNHPKIDDFLKTSNIQTLDLKNSLIILKNDKKKKFNNIGIDKKNILILNDFPIEINKLIQILNIQLIKQKYSNQSKFIIKDYIINLNSRTISKGMKQIKLTEKEINIILFLNSHKKPQKVDILQNEVWGYSSDLETHTVETHIYRLRKKIKDMFRDDNFIASHVNGYLIS